MRVPPVRAARWERPAGQVYSGRPHPAFGHPLPEGEGSCLSVDSCQVRANHYPRDLSFGEDASRVRARHAPINNATLDNIALAIVFHDGFRFVPEANLHFAMHRSDALHAIIAPT